LHPSSIKLTFWWAAHTHRYYLLQPAQFLGHTNVNFKNLTLRPGCDFLNSAYISDRLFNASFFCLCSFIPLYCATGSRKKSWESAMSWFHYKSSHTCPRMTFYCFSDYSMNQIYFFAETEITCCEKLKVKSYIRWHSNQNYSVWMWVTYLWKEHFISLWTSPMWTL
jgi:hypothetical protein